MNTNKTIVVNGKKWTHIDLSWKREEPEPYVWYDEVEAWTEENRPGYEAFMEHINKNPEANKSCLMILT